MTNPTPSLPQDGGDGEKAAGAVNNGLRAVQDDPNWYQAITQFQEVDADADSVTFEFVSGATTFSLRLSKSQ